MIVWNSRLFCTDIAREKLEEIRKKVYSPKKLKIGVYLITLNENGKDLLDIFSIFSFPQKHFKSPEHRIEVVGVATTFDDARELAAGIVARIYHETGDFDVKAWFKE